MSNWRVGAKVPLNVYEGDRPVCQCHTPEDALRIVQAFQRAERLEKALQEISTTRQRWMQMSGSYADGETNAGFALRFQALALEALAPEVEKETGA